MTVDMHESVERPYGWIVTVASLLMMTIGAGGYFVVIVGLKPVAEDFGGLRWVPSMAYSVTIFGMGLGGIFIGRWSDRSGVGTPALLGAVMVAVGAAVVSVTTNRWTFLLAHGILIGLLGNAALFSPLLANIARWFDRRRGLAVAIVISAQGLAGIVWPAIFRLLIERSSWREAYRVYAVFAVLTMVPLSLLLRPRAPVVAEHGSTAGGASRLHALGLGTSGVLALLCLAIVGCCAAMAMPIVHILSHTTDLGYPLARAAEVLAVLLGFGFVGRIAWGTVGDRIGGLRMLLLGSASQAIVLSLFLVVDSLSGLYVLSALFGLAFGGIIPSYVLIISTYFPAGSLGWRIATVYFFGAVGMALGGWLGGFIFDLSGAYRGAFAIGLLFNLVNLAVVGSLSTREAPALRTASA